jgi:hypothetical protein
MPEQKYLVSTGVFVDSVKIRLVENDKYKQYTKYCYQPFLRFGAVCVSLLEQQKIISNSHIN